MATFRSFRPRSGPASHRGKVRRIRGSRILGTDRQCWRLRRDARCSSAATARRTRSSTDGIVLVAREAEERTVPAGRPALVATRRGRPASSVGGPARAESSRVSGYRFRAFAPSDRAIALATHRSRWAPSLARSLCHASDDGVGAALTIASVGTPTSALRALRRPRRRRRALSPRDCSAQEALARRLWWRRAQDRRRGTGRAVARAIARREPPADPYGRRARRAVRRRMCLVRVR